MIEQEDQVSRDTALAAEVAGEELNMVASVLNTYEGRWFVWNLLSACGVYDDGFDLNPLEMARRSGRRQIGLATLQNCLTANPNVYNMMRREHQVRMETLEKRKEMAEGNETQITAGLPGDASAQAKAGTAVKAEVGKPGDGSAATAAGKPGEQVTPEQKAAAEKAAAEAAKAAEEARKNETPEAKAAREKQEAEDKAKKEAEDKENAVPEKYDFKFPEGIEADKEAIAQFEPLAKELKLSQKSAQKLVDFQSNLMRKAAEGLQTRWDTVREGWRNEVDADADIGGQKKDEALNDAKAALKAFGTPKLFEALNQTGVGDHPEFIRVFSKIGRLIREDKIVTGGSSAQAKKPEDKLYNHPNS